MFVVREQQEPRRRFGDQDDSYDIHPYALEHRLGLGEFIRLFIEGIGKDID